MHVSTGSLVASPRRGPTPTTGSDTGLRAAGTRRRSVTRTSLANGSQVTVINSTTLGLYISDSHLAPSFGPLVARFRRCRRRRAGRLGPGYGEWVRAGPRQWLVLSSQQRATSSR
ncbi:hypothetical protein E2C01_002389 [Portunus trituberculatus]|uniref:Uncharacterized protein n=1 Tax=Portunus trituberculatus TaxID=210409 RepID=A0A5B7CJ92_PORTR|nr:hypothetical protein [Portunus trituberculatus]